jgi:dihydrofolate reductase
MRVSLIAAVARNGVIGRDNGLPWRLPTDLARFQRLTWGHHVVMGHRTFSSDEGRLPGRITVVLSRDPAFRPWGVSVARSLDDALDLTRRAGEDEVFIAGGTEVYRQGLAVADRLYLTEVHAEVHGDTFFPDIDLESWQLVDREDHPADERNEHPFSFLTYERR